MSTFWDKLSQFFPPKADFVEKDVPDLSGKVYIVTGSNTGVGKEVAQILYSKNAKVYIAARSEEKCLKAIEAIVTNYPRSKGELVYLCLDLADLTTIKASVEEFLSKETKLHVLFHNAGLQCPPQGSKSAQGYELQLGVHNVGPFLFTKLLTPVLVATAKTELASSVRVVWVSSSGAELGTPPGGVPLNNLDYHIEKSGMEKYSISKAGNYLHSTEYAKRHKADGVVSVALNPGNLASDLYRDQPKVLFWMVKLLLCYPPVQGAYTELFAGVSPLVTIEKTGLWTDCDPIVPWGRIMPIREDLVAASKSEAEGGTGIALKFWEWTEQQVKPYV